MFPVEHGRALAETIPEAWLLEVDGAGHGVGPIDKEFLANAILERTGSLARR